MSGKSFAAVMAVMAVVALLTFGVVSKGSKALEVGEVAPIAELPALAGDGDPRAGTSESIADYQGRWVLLNTWASWCDPCKDEVPDLTAFQDEHGGAEFTIVGVNSQDGTEDALQFEREYRINYPSIRDGSGGYADDLGMSGVPENVLIDPQGEVAFVFRGPLDAEMLDRQVLPLIEGGAA
ncbi:MAG: TlpA family protein disulfide reductase [Actinomycetota bacterium]|nr:TlpA family protein disulfide reductase [Actinomycetota bacterium]